MNKYLEKIAEKKDDAPWSRHMSEYRGERGTNRTADIHVRTPNYKERSDRISKGSLGVAGIMAGGTLATGLLSKAKLGRTLKAATAVGAASGLPLYAIGHSVNRKEHAQDSVKLENALEYRIKDKSQVPVKRVTGDFGTSDPKRVLDLIQERRRARNG